MHRTLSECCLILKPAQPQSVIQFAVRNPDPQLRSRPAQSSFLLRDALHESIERISKELDSIILQLELFHQG
jgi:hypothetical protein